MPINRDTSFTYLGHSTFKIKSPGGKIILIDPWVQNNPACPDNLKKLDKVDIMLITHGHFDHIGDAVDIWKQHKPMVVGIFETVHWMQTKGVAEDRCIPMNKGGTVNVDGIKVTMVNAVHSCGILDDGKIIYGGEAAGYVIEFENGFKAYHAGDTAVFSDMKLISEIYKPELAMLPIGDHFTMSPVEAAHACRFLRPKYVIPMHYGTFPVLTGTPQKLRELTGDLKEMEIIAIKPGETAN